MMPTVTIAGVSIPTFFVVISLSLSVIVIYLSQRVDQFQFPRRPAFDLALLLMVSAFLGGRLMHVIYEEPAYYAKYPWQILFFWQGGYVFYGGFVACVVASVAYCKIKKIIFFEVADLFAPLLSLAHAFGRLGCFFAGCCYGVQCQLPWALEGRHPTTIYLFGGEILIYLYLLFFEKKIKQMNRPELIGSVFVKWVLLHSLLRLFVEFYRDDFRGAFYNIPVFGHLSISQLISLGLVFACLVFFVSKIPKKA